MAALIRMARDEDAEQIMRNCFPGAKPGELADGFESDSAGTITMVAEERGQIRGHAMLAPSGATGWLMNVAVQAEYRGKGIAGQLIEKLADRARKMGLSKLAIHVREDNMPARRVYEKCGFALAARDGMRGAQLRYERALVHRGERKQGITETTAFTAKNAKDAENGNE